MSSFKQFPDWDVFSEREISLDMSDFLSPALEIKAIIQRHEEEITKERQDAEHAQHVLHLALARQAVLVYRFEVMLCGIEDTLAQVALKKVHRTLRIMKDQMLDGLRQAELEIENPLGKPYQQVENQVEVQGWRHSQEFTTEVVAEVLDPIVTYRTKIIHLGHVIVGAPQAEGQNGETVETYDHESTEADTKR